MHRTGLYKMIHPISNHAHNICLDFRVINCDALNKIITYQIYLMAFVNVLYGSLDHTNNI